MKSTMHPYQVLSTLGRNMQPIKDLGGTMLDQEGVESPIPSMLEVLLPTLVIHEARSPTPSILMIGLTTLSLREVVFPSQSF